MLIASLGCTSAGHNTIKGMPVLAVLLQVITDFSENITQLNANYCENFACIDNKVIT
jgi:hypothetical protein